MIRNKGGGGGVRHLGMCPMVDGQSGNFEFNFVVKCQVDHFDNEEFEF